MPDKSSVIEPETTSHQVETRDGAKSGERQAFALFKRLKTLIPHVFTLLASVALAQAIMVLASPLLTRLYSPRDFGVLAFFAAAVGALGSIGSMRCDVLIPLVKDEDHATSVLFSGFGLITTMVCTVAVIMLFFGSWISHTFHIPFGRSWAFWLPVSAGGLASYQLLNGYATRHLRFKLVARTRIWQAIGTVCVQLGLAKVIPNGEGLIIGDGIGRGLGSGSLLKETWKGLKRSEETLRFSRLKALVKEHGGFCLYASGSALTNNLGITLPSVLIAAAYDARTAGLFVLAWRVTQLPCTVLGQAIGQVYLGEAAKVRRAEGDVKRLFLDVGIAVGVIGVISGLALLSAKELIFGTIFGKQWIESGTFAVYMLPLVIVNFISYVLSSTLQLMRRQEIQFAWDVTRLIMTIGAIMVPHIAGWSAGSAVLTYSVTMTVLYGALVLLGYEYVRHHHAVE